jgi:hypothetical protein
MTEKLDYMTSQSTWGLIRIKAGCYQELYALPSNGDTLLADE